MAKKSLFTSVIPLTVLGIIMGVTNPKSEAYNQYASQRLVKQGERLVCEQTGLCKAGKNPPLVTNMAKKVIEPVISQSSKRTNLLLFSLYSTDLPGIGQYKTLGAFGNFLTYSEPKG